MQHKHLSLLSLYHLSASENACLQKPSRPPADVVVSRVGRCHTFQSRDGCLAGGPAPTSTVYTVSFTDPGAYKLCYLVRALPLGLGATTFAEAGGGPVVVLPANPATYSTVPTEPKAQQELTLFFQGAGLVPRSDLAKVVAARQNAETGAWECRTHGAAEGASVTYPRRQYLFRLLTPPIQAIPLTEIKSEIKQPPNYATFGADLTGTPGHRNPLKPKYSNPKHTPWADRLKHKWFADFLGGWD